MIIELLSELEQQGHSRAGIARKLGVSRRSVTRWWGGVEPLDCEKVELMLKGMLVGEYLDGILNDGLGETDGGNIFDRLRAVSRSEQDDGPGETDGGNIFDQLRRVHRSVG